MFAGVRYGASPLTTCVPPLKFCGVIVATGAVPLKSPPIAMVFPDARYTLLSGSTRAPPDMVNDALVFTATPLPVTAAVFCFISASPLIVKMTSLDSVPASMSTPPPEGAVFPLIRPPDIVTVRPALAMSPPPPDISAVLPVISPPVMVSVFCVPPPFHDCKPPP